MADAPVLEPGAFPKLAITGRQGNILWLTWNCVDFERRIVAIEDGDTKTAEALGVP